MLHFTKMFVQVNTLQAIKEYFTEALTDFYSKGEIQVLFEIVCEHFLGLSRIAQKTKSDLRLTESEMLDFHFTVKRLKTYEPIQYILGEAPFLGLLLQVSPHTLIPRPETEELAQLIIDSINHETSLLDIGTGSGCIPIAIKGAKPGVEVFATDVSSEALSVAQRNAEQNGVEIKFAQHDILSDTSLPDNFPGKFDIIVSNPPYVRHSEKNFMQKSVLDYEPHLALFVEDNDPLIFYRKIAQCASQWLNENGKLYFEINQYLAEQTLKMIEKEGFTNVRLIKDINDNIRILYAEK